MNGSVLCLSEATGAEAEVEVEDNSRLTVNGMLGIYGSRIELEVSSSGGRLEVNGTLALGLAQDLEDDLFRSDDFEFEMDGTVLIHYDLDLVQTAIDGLTGLEVELGVGSTGSSSYSFSVSGSASGNLSGYEALAEVQQLAEVGLIVENIGNTN